MVSTAGSSVEVTGLAFFLSQTLAPKYKPLMSNLATYYGVRVQKINPIPAGAAVLSVEGQGAGTGVGSPLPAQVSGMISLYSALAGRRNRGRCYVPFPTETANDELQTRPDATYQAALVVLADAFSTNLLVTDGVNNAVLEPGIWSRASRIFNPIVDYNARARWATQRSRGNYGRPNPLPPF